METGEGTARTKRTYEGKQQGACGGDERTQVAGEALGNSRD